MTNPRKFTRPSTEYRAMTQHNAAVAKACSLVCVEVGGSDLRAGDVLVCRYKFTGSRQLYVQRVTTTPSGKVRAHVEGADGVPLYWPTVDVGKYERVLILEDPDKAGRG